MPKKINYKQTYKETKQRNPLIFTHNKNRRIKKYFFIM